MQSQWNDGQAYYRCRYRDDYPVDEATHPPSIYVKEDAITPGLDAWLAAQFDDEHIDVTAYVLAGHSEPDDEAAKREAQLRAGIAECDRKLAKYRALLDHDEVVEVAAKWIAETQRERKALERQLGHQIPGGKLTTAQVEAAGVGAAGRRRGPRHRAEPADKAEAYRGPRRLAHVRPQRVHPGQRPAAWGTSSCRRGTCTLTPRGPATGTIALAA
jgi:hypothetical protein